VREVEWRGGGGGFGEVVAATVVDVVATHRSAYTPFLASPRLAPPAPDCTSVAVHAAWGGGSWLNRLRFHRHAWSSVTQE
jgi:hypothetical protein